MTVAIKQKTCRVCNVEFKPFNSLTRVCSISCARKFASEQTNKQIRKVNKEKLEGIKTKSVHLKELQTIFNQYIRLRDCNYPCISCQTTNKIQYHAGHFQAIGGHPNLRFNEFNVNKQCQRCNTELHGNLLMYRMGLILKYGLDKVQELESNQSVAVHYSIPEIIELKSMYKQKINQLK